MKRTRRRALILGMVVPAMALLLACGSDDVGITLDLTSGDGPSAFADASVADLVVNVKSVVGSLGKVLDANRDNIPDAYVYPSGCGQAQPPLCGYVVSQPQVVTLSGLAKGYAYEVAVRFRASNGNVLYEGKGTIDTQIPTVSAAITVNKK